VPIEKSACQKLGYITTYIKKKLPRITIFGKELY